MWVCLLSTAGWAMSMSTSVGASICGTCLIGENITAQIGGVARVTASCLYAL